jgi:2-oxo-4-hydroxy-4-carboxy-5-ureidoimidazoline decarboxylase
MTINELNSLDCDHFVNAIGWIFEHSPWVAGRAWRRRPFSTIQVLHQALVDQVESAFPEEQLFLLRAHPDLGTPARISAASSSEQAGAGLDRRTPQEFPVLQQLNADYREKFGFPFPFAVKGSTKTRYPTSTLRAAPSHAGAGAPGGAPAGLSNRSLSARGQHATKFRNTYPQVEGALVSVTEISYVPFFSGSPAFTPSGPERGTARIEFSREGIVEVVSGIRDFRWLTIGRSAFHGFVRDQYTTLPDTRNRPLHMRPDLEWHYSYVARRIQWLNADRTSVFTRTDGRRKGVLA